MVGAIGHGKQRSGLRLFEDDRQAMPPGIWSSMLRSKDLDARKTAAMTAQTPSSRQQ
jgi:hypothetical protein